MSRSIIEAAVNNKTLHLELTYRTPFTLGEEDDTAELELPTRCVPPPPVRPISGEFACLLSVL
jgi:hypothetical protein